MSTEVCKFQTLKPDQTYEVKSIPYWWKSHKRITKLSKIA